ncbi:hypothetical protein [Corynebacterium liangguodongii]|uniref:Uncharacterized protein n=1 Tax=Corynebacterium liangguodongii TaxID=2079535 RepID=A0A2S0WBY1_9CORY|nr:hypothetical protein [Corynebacterium liangguodongii]AWB83273.1 hypothetical protein C3E79_01215 [Corynebacterium liangguodongii]PWC00637.1 hypothetical protein DF219_01735 [Corynebacterium liangguodongii]
MRKATVIFAAIVAVVAVVVTVIAIRHVWPGAKGPLGWDDEEVARVFAGDRIGTCDLGEEFYASIGISDVSLDAENNLCTGYATSAGVKAPIVVAMDNTAAKGNLQPAPAALTGEGLEGWMASEQRPEAPEDPTKFFYDRDGLVCVMYSEAYALEGLTLGTPAGCDTLRPLAVQLNNLASQHESTRSYTDPGSTVLALSNDVYDPLSGSALAAGATAELELDDHDKSTMTITSVSAKEEQQSIRYCANATVTMGDYDAAAKKWLSETKKTPGVGSAESGVGDRDFSPSAPNVVLTLPDGTRLNMSYKSQDFLSAEPGSQAPVEYCASVARPAISGGEVIVSTNASKNYSTLSPVSWKVRPEEKAAR